MVDYTLSDLQAEINGGPFGSRQKLAAIIEETADFDLLTQDISSQIVNSNLPRASQLKLLKQIAKKCDVSVSALLSDAKQSIPKQEIETGSWKKKLIHNDQGEIQVSLFNIALILSNDPEWKDVFALDVFSDRTLKLLCPPFEPGETGEWTDRDDSKTAIWLTEKYQMNAPTTLVAEAVQVAADNNRFNPVQDYLDSIKWDGRPRLTMWPITYLGASDLPYTRLIGKCWMVGAVARVFQPGCKMDNVLILEGPQGLGKSTVLDVLGGEWYADTDADLGSKDSYIVMRGKWIIELGELDAFNRAESAKAKRFFAAKDDTYRPPYGRRSVTVPRSCVFAGSVNLGEYLRDETGNRRYWPLRVRAIEKERLARDRDQLWAEAVAMYRQGESWWIQNNLHYVESEQEQRFTRDAWEDIVEDWVNFPRKTHVTTGEVLRNCLDIPSAKWGKPEQMRVGGILKRLGYTRRKVRNPNEPSKPPRWFYVLGGDDSG